MASDQMYRIVWSIPGESQCPFGSGAKGFGAPVTLEVARSFVEHYQRQATTGLATLKENYQSTRFQTRGDFKETLFGIPKGMQHRIVPADESSPTLTPTPSIPTTSSFPSPTPSYPTSSQDSSQTVMGISSQGLLQIMTVLGGRSALEGLSLGKVFEKYAEKTQMEDPVTSLTLAVRSMLRNS
jgi:hypothetical protein